MFHSEADFQHALAWQIHEAAPESQVRLEVSVIPVEAQRMFLDIWLPVEGVAIELKYATRKVELFHDGESFLLKDHGAQDIRRHDFVLDVQRLETVRSRGKMCKEGYAIFLTNDSSYWKVPNRRNTVDAAFRIHDGREVSGALAWATNAGQGTIKGRESAILLRGSYRLRWQDFSMFPLKPYGQFRHLVVSVH